MEGSTVNFSEDGGGRGRDAAGGKDVASCARFGQEDYERPDGGVFQAVQRQYASCATAGDGSQVGDAFTRSVDVCGTPDGAEPQPVLSEALRDPHWGEEGLLMNRGPPGNDWATFSPVDSSSRYHTTDASNWVQTIAESSEEEPTITSDTPGWQAFSLGGDVATTTTTSASWSETSASVGDSNAPATAGRKQSGNCGAGERDQTEPCATVYSRSCVTVFRECFTSAEGASNGRRGEEREGRPRPVTAECVGDWRCMEDNSFAELLWRWSQTSLHHPPPSCCQARLSSLLRGGPSLNECDGGGAWSLALPLGSEERFDWTASDSRRRRSMSPDVVPNLFRPRKESLVNVDFDHDRAASGLAVLSEVELQRMCGEMTSKFSRLSAELLTCLQTRDILAGEMEAKNRFVSALLRVEQLRLSQDTNGSSGEAGRGRQWVWGQKRKDDEPLASRYLQAVIPYKTPEGMKWRTNTVTLLTKVLKAISEGSNTVPKLMSEYLQSEFLTSPVTDRHHSFKDSLSPDQNTVLSNLSL